jgi:hypothetical protein
LGQAWSFLNPEVLDGLPSGTKNENFIGPALVDNDIFPIKKIIAGRLHFTRTLALFEKVTDKFSIWVELDELLLVLNENGPIRGDFQIAWIFKIKIFTDISYLHHFFQQHSPAGIFADRLCWIFYGFLSTDEYSDA